MIPLSALTAMHPYRLTTLAFAVVMAAFFLFAGGLVITLRHEHKLPAPRISDSVSFNEKALWLRHAFQQGRTADIIIAGSSMGVNNLDAGEIATLTGTRAVMNTSSWGLTVPQSFDILRIVAPRLRPRLVIMPVYFGDFQKAQVRDFDWPRFQDCLFAPGLAPLYLENLDVIYFQKAYAYRQSPASYAHTFYESLQFDPYGGVLLSAQHFDVDPRRWEGVKDQHLNESLWDPDALSQLQQMGAYLRERKCALLVVACPMRQAMEARLTDKLEPELWAKLPGLLGAQGNFVHISGPDFDDSFFADYAHLNERGARKLTDLIAPNIQQALQEQAAW